MSEPNQEAFFELARLAFLAEELEEAEEPQRKKRLWVKKWVSRRDVEVPIFKEIQVEDRAKFLADFRLYPEDFDKLLARYQPLKKIIYLGKESFFTIQISIIWNIMMTCNFLTK